MRHEGRLHFPGEIPNGMPSVAKSFIYLSHDPLQAFKFVLERSHRDTAKTKKMS
jgi:hypothetical protein